ncbi:MAG: radical SAM family heme chaperone HemW [Anaerolineales bacterium]|nr:radical SAM family heme chaperone HemW [Anaerolineales bacterium]MCB8950448.1 radical SAM family heme chaperone HemW [Ardenticatenales bacterium]
MTPVLASGSLSLYLHIPFCRHRCAYCDFNTYTSLDDLKDAYAAALCREIAQAAAGIRRPAHTLFFGGGTPSLMPATRLADILRAVRTHFDLHEVAEITLEANPGTVDTPYLEALRAMGVNRLSFGVQSAHAEELALLERAHSFADVAAAVVMSRNAGIHNLNLDLIYGLPGQTLASWRASLQAALALRPQHLSLYCLIIEPGTPMHRWLQTGRISPPDPDLAADQYELARQILAEAGFIHYEISNWALPGHECAHNLTYWRNQEYLGLGAGAHGYAAGCRYHIVKQPRVYIRRMAGSAPGPYPLTAAVADAYQLTRRQAMADTIITQLRLLQEGLDIAAFTAKFDQSVTEAYNGTVTDLIQWGLLRQTEGFLRLTERGYFLSNQVFYRFL